MNSIKQNMAKYGVLYNDTIYIGDECVRTYIYKDIPGLLLANISISHKLFNTRVGRILFNIETKEYCFGLYDTNDGMVAMTVTDKGEFWNGLLMVVIKQHNQL